MAQKYIEYTHNNSGGVYWLSEKNWQDLIEAGWIVVTTFSKRILSIKRIGLSMDDAVAEWEKITGLDSQAQGCDCCGMPHAFYEFDEEDEFISEMNATYGPTKEIYSLFKDGKNV